MRKSIGAVIAVKGNVARSQVARIGTVLRFLARYPGDTREVLVSYAWQEKVFQESGAIFAARHGLGED